MPEQSVCPDGHAHVPRRQICPPLHAVVHEPQCVASVCRSTHDEPHRVVLPLQPVTHVIDPDTIPHTGVPVGHALPHEPQWAGSLSDASHPFACIMSQSA